MFLCAIKVIPAKYKPGGAEDALSPTAEGAVLEPLPERKVGGECGLNLGPTK